MDKSEAESRRLIKPSDMLRRSRAIMEILIDLEDLVRIDVVTVFSNVFEQHTQPSSDTSKVGQCLAYYGVRLAFFEVEGICPEFRLCFG